MVLLEKTLIDSKKDMFDKLAFDSIEYFEKSFQREGFTDESGRRKKWKERVYTTRQKSRKTLTQRGYMKKAFTFRKKGKNSVLVINNADYGRYHNEGASYKVTAKQLAYFRFRADSAIREDDADFWRNMAKKKVGSTVVIPERQFMGESKTLVNKHKRSISWVINRHIQKINVNSIVKV